jgi:hypothetical protein
MLVRVMLLRLCMTGTDLNPSTGERGCVSIFVSFQDIEHICGDVL